MCFWTVSILHSSKELENTMFQKLELFPSSDKGRETPTLLGPLERLNLNHWLYAHLILGQFKRR
jgi:hypothetical protein